MTAKIISTLPKNDNSCGWIKQLPLRLAQPALSGKQHADWVVLGAGLNMIVIQMPTKVKV